MMLDNFAALIEDITVFQPNATISDDGEHSFTRVLTKGIWKDSSKILQTGLSSYTTCKAIVILTVDVLNGSFVERGNVLNKTISANQILLKKTKRSVDGTFEGTEVYL